MAKCRECSLGELEILGTGGFGDLIEVECKNPECNEIYEVESDGLGDGGFEFVEAQRMDWELHHEADEQLNRAIELEWQVMNRKNYSTRR